MEVAQLCLTLCDPTDYTVHGILQARILEWAAFPFSRGSSQPRDQTQVSHIAGGLFTNWAVREALVAPRQVESSQTSPALAGEFLPTAPPGNFWYWPTFHKLMGQLDTWFWDISFFCLCFILDWLSFSCWFGGVLYIFLIWVLRCIMHYKYFLPFYGLSVFYLDSEKQKFFILLRLKFSNNFLRLLWLVLFLCTIEEIFA